MKLFGHTHSSEQPFELREVTFQASPDALRTIARFLEQMATELEEAPSSFEHSHVQDTFEEWPSQWPDLVVAGLAA